MARDKKHMSLFAFTATMVFFYAPLLVLVLFSFNASKTMTWSGFSLRWYNELFFGSRDLWRALGNSAIIALTSASVSALLGTLAAIGMYWYNFRLKKYVEISSFLPLIIPEIIIGVSLLIMFGVVGMPLGLGTIFIAHTTFCLPYAMLIVSSRLDEFDYSIVEAAYDLGATEPQALLRVIVPVSMPGIIAAFLVSITLSLEDFVITFFVAGPGSSTLPLHIYSMIRFGVSPVINALSVMLMAASVVLAFSTRGLVKYVAKG
ncbi:MAG TPA: ABC transporter permease [Chitinivibrionales bacterium]|jgi:spermidine/putrescine transport system permease protein|nr:ABC transporter permease [Chitinivibrionales bacterium]